MGGLQDLVALIRADTPLIVVGDVVRGVALATQDAVEAAPQARCAT